jgi:hypothetical protein
LTIALVLFPLAALAQPAAQEAQQALSVINGAVVDDTGTGIRDAVVVLTHDALPRKAETSTGPDGRFSFLNLPAGSFQLTVTAPGFAEQVTTGVVMAAETTTLQAIRLRLAVGAVTVDVLPTEIVAERQIKEQEQQRVLGVLPNFMVSYNPDAAPLTTNQKFELSWKSHLDPVSFGLVAVAAAIEQKRNAYTGFGDGAEGYAKRYAVIYATVFTRGVITQVVLPTVFKQDPRYFYKGTGSTPSRLAYAVSRVVVRRGDDKRSHPNYSGIFGSVAAGAVSNLYYPSESRGLRLTAESTALGVIGGMVNYLAQEFIFPKLTTRASTSTP